MRHSVDARMVSKSRMAPSRMSARRRSDRDSGVAIESKRSSTMCPMTAAVAPWLEIAAGVAALANSMRRSLKNRSL